MNEETVAQGEAGSQRYRVEICVWDDGKIGDWRTVFVRTVDAETVEQIKALAVKP